jgi:hypothetical protein
MATIKEATQSVIAFAQETLGPERTLGLRLEEVESDQVGNNEVWRITLSMLELSNLPSAISSTLNALNNRREYKTFTVRTDTGEVTSMKIREIAS